MLSELDRRVQGAGRSLKIVAMTVGAVVIAAAGSLAAAPAALASGCVGQGCPPPGISHGASSGEAVFSVYVSGTGVVGGGQHVSIPMSQLSNPPVCWIQAGVTGAEYYQSWQPGGWSYEWNYTNEMVAEVDKYDPYPDYEDHADDDEGRWYVPRCSSAHHDEDVHGPFYEYTSTFFANNQPRFVPASEPPPAIDIPPITLAYIAYDYLTLPEPELGWNPKRSGDEATFVNVDTWVWLEDSPESLDVTASAGGNSATVVASLSGMTIDAPDSAAVECTGTGVAWSPSADPAGACVFVFGRSSANQPGLVTPVTVEAHWVAEWYANGVLQGELDSQSMSETTPVPVAEVQSVVSG